MAWLSHLLASLLVLTFPPPPHHYAHPASRSRPTEQRDESGWRLSVTAYCTGSITASGKTPAVGMAAGNRWPFGTRLQVPGWGIVVVEDRIGWGSDLDLYMSSCQEARTWGRKTLLVLPLGAS